MRQPIFITTRIRRQRQEPEIDFFFDNDFIFNQERDINNIAARLFNQSINTPETRRTNPDLAGLEELDILPVTQELISELEENSRVYLIQEDQRASLSEVLQNGDIADNLVHSDGWVYDYRDLTAYAQANTNSYTLDAGVISNPMTRAPIDLRTASSRIGEALGTRVERQPASPPQRILRSDLERLLPTRAQTTQTNPRQQTQVNPQEQMPSEAQANQGIHSVTTATSATSEIPELPRSSPLSRSASSSSIATVDELNSEYLLASFLKRANPNSRAWQRRFNAHLTEAFNREEDGQPTVLTQGVRTRSGGQASALDIAAHYGRLSAMEDMLEISDTRHIQLRSARAQPEAALLARAERNESLFDTDGRHNVDAVD